MYALFYQFCTHLNGHNQKQIMNLVDLNMKIIIKSNNNYVRSFFFFFEGRSFVCVTSVGQCRTMSDKCDNRWAPV